MFKTVFSNQVRYVTTNILGLIYDFDGEYFISWIISQGPGEHFNLS